MVQNFIIRSSHRFPEELDPYFMLEEDDYQNQKNIIKTPNEIKKVISAYRAAYINEDFIELIHEVFTDEDILFVPIKTSDGFIFLHHQIFNQYDDDQIAEFISNKGGVDILYNLSEESIHVIHANFGYENCFQNRGKYDYGALGKRIQRKYDSDSLYVCGRFAADFVTEDGEDYSVDEIIFQEYEGGYIDDCIGWERDKVDEEGNFQVEREVEERNIGSGAIDSFMVFSPEDHMDLSEIEKWFDADYVAENARA